jgi:hypothetical protein
MYVCRHLARALAFATQSAMLSCQLVLHAPSFMPFSVPSPSMLTFMDHMLIGLCPHLLLCFICKTHLLKQFLIEAMDIKQPESQESIRISRTTWSFSTSTSSSHIDYITYYHWDPHPRRTWTYQATSSYYQRVFSRKETQIRPRMERVSHCTIS